MLRGAAAVQRDALPTGAQRSGRGPDRGRHDLAVHQAGHGLEPALQPLLSAALGRGLLRPAAPGVCGRRTGAQPRAGRADGPLKSARRGPTGVRRPRVAGRPRRCNNPPQTEGVLVKYLYLVWAALRRRPVRTFLTLLSVTTAFFLFGVLQGINLGIDGVFKMLNTAHLRVMSRVNMNDPMPISHARRMAAIPGVAHVTGLTVVFGSYQQPRNIQIALAVDIDETFQIYETMKVQPQVLAAMRRTRSGAIVGRALARKYGWKVGDHIPIHAFNVTRKDGSADWVFDIVGFYDMEQSEWASNMWVHYDYVNEARGAGKDTAMQFMVGINDARQAAKISQAIDDAFANSPAQTTTQNEKDFVESLLRQIGDISFLVNGIVGAVLFTLLFLTANTMAQSVRERIPELAVLKTVGFSDNTVQWLV